MTSESYHYIARLNGLREVPNMKGLGVTTRDSTENKTKQVFGGEIVTTKYRTYFQNNKYPDWCIDSIDFAGLQQTLRLKVSAHLTTGATGNFSRDWERPTSAPLGRRLAMRWGKIVEDCVVGGKMVGLMKLLKHWKRDIFSDIYHIESIQN